MSVLTREAALKMGEAMAMLKPDAVTHPTVYTDWSNIVWHMFEAMDNSNMLFDDAAVFLDACHKDVMHDGT